MIAKKTNVWKIPVGEVGVKATKITCLAWLMFIRSNLLNFSGVMLILSDAETTVFKFELIDIKWYKFFKRLRQTIRFLF